MPAFGLTGAAQYMGEISPAHLRHPLPAQRLLRKTWRELPCELLILRNRERHHELRGVGL